MEDLIRAIEDEKFAQVKTIVYRSPELLTQTFNRNGQKYTPIELSEEYARKNTHKNAISPKILTYLKSMLPVPAKSVNAPATLRNLQSAVQRSDLSSVKRILDTNPGLINKQYEHASGEPYTILKTAQEIYPNNDSIKLNIINELLARGAHFPPEIPLNYPPSNPVIPLRNNRPPLYPSEIPPRNVTRGIAMKFKPRRKTRRRKN